MRLLPPHDVRRYVRRNKTDRADAKALLEAARNEEIHAVPVKSETQQAMASLHRIRSAWLGTRTARLNALRGLLREFGVTIPVGARHVVPHVSGLIEDADAPVPVSLRPTLAALCEEIRTLEGRIRALERHLAALAEQLPHVAHLRTIPGIGILATALVACVGRSGPRNLDSGLSGISIVFQAAVPKPVVPKYTTSGVRRPSEL